MSLPRTLVIAGTLLVVLALRSQSLSSAPSLEPPHPELQGLTQVTVALWRGATAQIPAMTSKGYDWEAATKEQVAKRLRAAGLVVPTDPYLFAPPRLIILPYLTCRPNSDQCAITAIVGLNDSIVLARNPAASVNWAVPLLWYSQRLSLVSRPRAPEELTKMILLLVDDFVVALKLENEPPD